jgi:hypothetical protein
LTRIFETLNRTGVKLDAFDLMVAILYPHGFHLGEQWFAAQEKFPLLKAMDISGLEVLKILALRQRDAPENAARGKRAVSGVRQRDVLNIPPDFVREQWPAAVQNYSDALAFSQRNLGVVGAGWIPSEAMMLTLAYRLWHQADPADIIRWWWRAVLTQRYAQGANTQVVTDVANWPERRMDAEELSAVARNGLLDPIRRNRILRLGIRGLLHVRGDARDPFTGQPLGTDLDELHISKLDSRLAAASPEAQTVDLLLANTVTQAAQPIERSAVNLRDDALRSQGFPAGLIQRPSKDWREQRANILSDWMTGLA